MGPGTTRGLRGFENRSNLCSIARKPRLYKILHNRYRASGRGLGGVLTHVDDDGIEHPIVYISRLLSLPESNYSVSELECLGVLWSIKNLRVYVETHSFTVITDHSRLLWFKNLKDPTSRLARWSLQMQQWDFQIKHRKGTLYTVYQMRSRESRMKKGEKR